MNYFEAKNKTNSVQIPLGLLLYFLCLTGRELSRHSAVCSIIGRCSAVHPLPGSGSAGDPASAALLFTLCRTLH